MVSGDCSETRPPERTIYEFTDGNKINKLALEKYEEKKQNFERVRIQQTNGKKKNVGIVERNDASFGVNKQN